MAVKIKTKQKYSAFSYKSGNSFVHRCPAWIKILFIPLFSLCTFYLPPVFSVFLIILQFSLARYLKFSAKEMVADLKPILYYFFLLAFTKVLIWAGSGFSEHPSLDWQTCIMLLKLFCLMQLASIVFKTSTSLELREGISLIESKCRKFLHLREKNTLTDTISLFVNFIPMVSKNWQQAERAWKARGGKKSLKMYFTLIPVLFSVGMKQAYNSARAICAREITS